MPMTGHVIRKEEAGISFGKFPSDSSAKRYLKELRKYPPMNRAEEQETIRRARTGDEKAQERLITANLRFVVSVALEYQGRGLPLSDLIAEGNLGLMEALKRFDEKRGYKFISYAVWWIRQAILNALKRTSTIQMPANRQEDLDRIARRSGQMAQKLGRFPGLLEIAEDMELSLKRAERAICSMAPIALLETGIGDDEEDGFTLGDVIEIDDPDPDELVLKKSRLEMINAALRCLNDREIKVIREYFGLSGIERRTLKAIGADLGITKERVRQIRNDALAELRMFFTQRSVDEENWKDII
jgi:RNA polymerase primary sigma factor